MNYPPGPVLKGLGGRSGGVEIRGVGSLRIGV
jgi:hypothetical protein